MRDLQMSENKRYILCGGTFLTLLLHARKQRTAARKNAAGEKDGLSDSELFEGLIRVAFPYYISPAGRSIKTYTSSYKSCKLSSNEYLPFNHTELTANFDRIIKENYNIALKRMCEFTSKFIDVKNMGNWLVRAVMETIHYDSSIKDGLFYADNEGQPLDKKHLLMTREISLQPFLLGVWHFILMHRPNNTIGADTYEIWHSPAPTSRARRKFISNIGKDWNKEIKVNIISLNSHDSNDFYESRLYNNIPDGMDALLYPDGIAPELTGNAPWILIPKGILPSNDDISKYLTSAYEKYSKIKTLLYNAAPKDFYDFYICNDIHETVYVKGYENRTNIIHDATAETLRRCSNFILISGTGGLGKSMMMRHLLLDAIDNFDKFGKIPIFIPLKDYGTKTMRLLNYIYEQFTELNGTDNIEDFSDSLSYGIFFLLFDGLDEIKSDYRKIFEHELEIFADKYKNNMFIISSRPTGSFISMHRFTILKLCPFTKEQALALIDKLDFRPDEPNIKNSFRNELKTNLYVTHREFTENPLLLTIMLMTYEQFAEIPSKMHIFYREAYAALSQKHDANKGAYSRALKTGLTADRFADYFAEFCARSYRDEKYEFTDILFDKYFRSLHEHAKESYRVTVSDFRDDLIENMCLMYYEGGKYHFTHRSFQEYFCALYFSKQKDKTLKYIGDLFESKTGSSYSDNTFSMMFDMIPEKIEEYIFEPFLTSLFKTCDEENGYWTFLQRMHPILYYEDGETNECYGNEPNSYIYNFIISIRNIQATLEDVSMPLDEVFVTNEWVYLDNKFNSSDYDTDVLIERRRIPLEYEEWNGIPDIVGRNYEIHIDRILQNPNIYKDILELLNSDDFPIKVEYLKSREYMQELIDKRETVGDDLFDLFQ